MQNLDGHSNGQAYPWKHDIGVSLDNIGLMDREPLGLSIQMSKSTRSKDQEFQKYDPNFELFKEAQKQEKKEGKLLDKYHKSNNKYSNLIVQSEDSQSYDCQMDNRRLAKNYGNISIEKHIINSNSVKGGYQITFQTSRHPKPETLSNEEMGKHGSKHLKKYSNITNDSKKARKMAQIGSFADSDINTIRNLEKEKKAHPIQNNFI